MDSKEQMNHAETRMQSALGAFLKTRSAIAETDSRQSAHLDDDVLTAFVEGNLSEQEAMPVMKHMSDCSFCLHVSAELIRLDEAMGEETTSATTSVSSEPTKVGEVLGGILSRIFGSGDGEVFAHEEKEDEADEETKDEEI
jgi:hypothetical protein